MPIKLSLPSQMHFLMPFSMPLLLLPTCDTHISLMQSGIERYARHSSTDSVNMELASQALQRIYFIEFLGGSADKVFSVKSLAWFLVLSKCSINISY